MSSVLNVYHKLHRHFGPRHWWPADTAFEVIVGAILTQNTAWSNVEKAIDNLKKAGALTPKKFFGIKTDRLARLIKPAGYYNIKAKRLKSFMEFLFTEYNGSVANLLKEKPSTLRQRLLAVKGVGPETADSIILYAANKPVFVVDAYTKRIFSRHGFIKPDFSYDAVQEFFTRSLPRRTKLFNEYHALIVETGKNFCRSKPKCSECPLKTLFPFKGKRVRVRGIRKC